MQMAKPPCGEAESAPIAYGPKPGLFAWMPRLLKQVVVLLATAGLAYVCFEISRHFLLQSVQVSGNSMAPTLADSDRYLLNRFVYLFRDPQPEDIVVLRDPQDHGYAVKRVIARPGDSVYVRDGHVYVNGVQLRERYLSRDIATHSGPDYRAQFWVCGANQYFVLGDNRNNSLDSRNYGAVAQSEILGRVMP